jgi:hypothetical protein
LSRSPSLNAITAAFAADPLASMSLTRPQADWVEMGSPADPEDDDEPEERPPLRAVRGGKK